MRQKKAKNTYHHGELVDSLLNAAVRFIEKEAHPEFTLRELAKAIGVSHPAVYRHFKSKQEIQAAIAAKGYDELTQGFAKLKTKKLNATELLIEQAVLYVNFAIENPGFFRAMFHPHLQITEEFEDLKKSADLALAALSEAVQNLFPPKQNLKKYVLSSLTAIFWANVHGIASLSVDNLISGPLDIGKVHPADLARIQARTFLSGLKLSEYYN